MFTRAGFDAATVNEEKRTVDVVWSTGAKGRRWYGYEELSMEPGAVRLDFLNDGAPILNNHRKYGDVSEDIIGRVIPGSVAVKRGEGRATLEFDTDDASDRVWQKIQRGFLRFVSVGYAVHKFERIRSTDEKEPDTYRAVDWEPLEISMVAVPFDRKSKLRAEDADTEVPVEIYEPSERSDDAPETPANTEADESTTRHDAATGEEANQPKPNQERDMPEINDQVDLEKERKDAVAAERKRVAEIKAAVRAAGLSDEFLQNLIDSDTTADQARKQVIDELAKSDPNKGARGAGRVEVGADETDKRRAKMVTALELRHNPSLKVETELKSAAREFRGMSLVDLARESIEANGGSTRGMSKREIAQTALSGYDSRGVHTTSDFPFLLGETFNRTLRRAYEERQPTFREFCRRVTLPDFREMSRVQLSGLVGDMEEVIEAAEYKSGTLDEAKETYRLIKYGKTVPITWESIINDDLSAFTRVPEAFANAAKQKQSDIVYSILLNNPAMADGNNLFDAVNHLNTIAQGTAINVDNLGIARAKIREQKGIEGNVLNLVPRFLIVGSANEQLALQFTSQNYVAAKSPDINVWAGTLTPIIEPRVTDKKWFLSADPAQVDTIEYAFLDGEEELFTEQSWDYKKDCYDLKARMVFAAKAIDWRGFFYNPGA
jgi:hypothetical protein